MGKTAKSMDVLGENPKGSEFLLPQLKLLVRLDTFAFEEEKISAMERRQGMSRGSWEEGHIKCCRITPDP